MPAVSSAQLMSRIVSDALATSNYLFARSDSNSAEPGIEVVCAWPVSGQYGPGSRIFRMCPCAQVRMDQKRLYCSGFAVASGGCPSWRCTSSIPPRRYLTVKCLQGAVDMDIYGAFQLCAIGILAAPVTVRLSRTYFYDPGRNTIFLWAGLILSGKFCRRLLSLTVEFYRARSITCSGVYNGIPIPASAEDFPYDKQPQCGMNCTDTTGPQSPMRGGAANNKYVIPAPDKLTFGTATLLSAACCVHAILWLASMMDKILEINFKSRFGFGPNTDLRLDEPIQGTNGATVGKMKRVNETIRIFISVAIVPIFAGAGLAILIIGETNFFSRQVRYENEPMASIGQWGPIVGTGLAIAGSLYLLLAADLEEVGNGNHSVVEKCQCKCSHHPLPEFGILRPTSQVPSSRDSEGMRRAVDLSPPPPVIESFSGIHHPSSTTSSSLHEMDTREGAPSKRYSFATINRHRVAEFLTSVGQTLGTATQGSFDLSKFRDGPALDFPEIPGERERNRDLSRVKEIYSQRLQPDGTPAVYASRSRASSFNADGPSGHALDGLRTSRDESPLPHLSRSASPVASGPGAFRQRVSTLPVSEPSSHELHAVASLPTASGGNRGRQRARRDTLEVPAPVHFNPHRHTSLTGEETIMGTSSSSPHHPLPLCNTSAIASGALCPESGTRTPDAATPTSSAPLNKHDSS
ncbi:hypothetical protein X797_001367 [Metarhizium robertsii]|uniref:Uncharacterized protein n=1 Tax=Metarhizium robertsii TaxID=568076 RepID=A0A0A1V8S2_9HYPO|nr:hypothetical protein X797_001367 [Metarhizium robertsii]